MSRYLSFARAVLAGLLLLVPATAAVETLTITAEQAIVRAKPGITQPILTVVPHGAIFPVLETEKESTVTHRIEMERMRHTLDKRGAKSWSLLLERHDRELLNRGDWQPTGRIKEPHMELGGVFCLGVPMTRWL